MHEHLRQHDLAQKGSSNRSFGLLFAAFFLIIALLPLLHNHGVRLWAVCASLVFCAISLAVPAILAPLNRLWTKFGVLLHNIVSPIALAILFYSIVTPIGLVMRLLGKDPLHLSFDPGATSYWIERIPPGPDAESLKNQF